MHINLSLDSTGPGSKSKFLNAEKVASLDLYRYCCLDPGTTPAG